MGVLYPHLHLVGIAAHRSPNRTYGNESCNNRGSEPQNTRFGALPALGFTTSIIAGPLPALPPRAHPRVHYPGSLPQFLQQARRQMATAASRAAGRAPGPRAITSATRWRAPKANRARHAARARKRIHPAPHKQAERGARKNQSGTPASGVVLGAALTERRG